MSGRTRPCEICGRLIDPERVEALPKTRLCTEHAQMIKQYGGEFILTGTQASLSKGGSLKRNYGDVSIEERRNTEALRKLRQEYDRLSREKADRGG
jgi:hypothetical protein